jgi:hypothetical protein
MLFLCLVLSGSLAAQVINESIALDWEATPRVIPLPNEQQLTRLYFEQAHYDPTKPQIPIFAQQFDLPTYGDVQATLNNAQYEPLAEVEGLVYPQRSALNVETQVTFERRKPIGIVSFVPIRKNLSTGQYEKLISADLQLTLRPRPAPLSRNSRNFVASSKLANGDLYKIAVTNTGVQKIDYNLLQSLGVDVDNIDPRRIQLLGQPGAAIPERMNVDRMDDVVENHIVVVGEQDGSFDPNDYILFYGVGPNTWSYTATASCSPFDHDINPYTKESYYFIKIGNNNGLRISSRASAANPTYTTSSYDKLQFHEEELLNLMEKEFALPPSGREWYGESFKITRTRSFNFEFSDRIESEPVVIKSDLAVRAFSNGTATMSVNNASAGPPVNVVPTNIQIYNDYATRLTFPCVGKVYSGQDLNVAISLNHGSSAAEMWLNYLSVQARCNLTFRSGQLDFRDQRSIGQGVVRYQLNGSNNLTIWDVTDPSQVQAQEYSGSSTLTFAVDATELREFVAFDGAQFYVPLERGSVANQNLHAMTTPPDAVFVVHSSLLAEAERLAAHRRAHDNIDVDVVEVEAIYNEFSSGSPDVSAIRDFCRMLYERETATNKFTHVCLFGLGSFDYKSIGEGRADKPSQNLVPLYQTPQSLHPTSTYTSDDYFALLDPTEDMFNFGLLDIAVGRLPVATVEEARAVVDKIIRYETHPNTFKDWKNRLCFVADDEDTNKYFYHSEGAIRLVEERDSTYNVEKIYIDAFKQVSTSGGQRYPDAKNALLDALFKGTFVINYIGHGGDDGWTQERVFTSSDINQINNQDRLPLFITATCSFGPHDDPNIVSAAELLLLHPTNGTASIMTTLRVVIASDNQRLVNETVKVLFLPKANGQMPTTGEVLQMAKNNAGLRPPVNSRKYGLLGDPTMKLAYPNYEVKTTNINNRTTSTSTQDTLRALQRVTIKGEIVDDNGNKVQNFNGIIFPTVFDKPDRLTTLGNDPGSRASAFFVRKKIIFKGQASVINGEFSFSFVVPKDINYTFGRGKISYYAKADNSTDASGYHNQVVIGGSLPNAPEDNQGPDVLVFMNTEEFARGGITNNNPKILVQLYDENGINTVGNSIGHDLTSKVLAPDQSEEAYVLNDFYESKKDDYTRGTAIYPLKDLKPGLHTIQVKAWDTYNNPGEGDTEFVVAESADMALNHVLNYPNPFTTSTNFQFEHNLPYQDLDIQVQIYTVSGKLVKTIDRTIGAEDNAGYRVDDLHWDGLDEFGDRIGRGVYIYKIFVQAQGVESETKQSSEFQKLVILK